MSTYEDFMNHFSWDDESSIFSMAVNTAESSDQAPHRSLQEMQATDMGYPDGIMDQFFLPGIDPLGTGSQPFKDESQLSVQFRTEGPHSYRNSSILSMDNQPPFNPPTQQDFPPVHSHPASPSSPQPYPQELTWLEDGPVSKYAPTMGSYMPSASSYKKSRRSTRNHEQKRHCEHPGCSKAFETDKGLARHARTHQSPNPNAKCQHCGLQLSRTDALRRHERACEEYLDALREGSR